MITQDMVDRAAAAGRRRLGAGKVTAKIPALAGIDPTALGLAVAPLGAPVVATGDCDEAFSIQSISKLFTFALLLSLEDLRAWERVRWLSSVSRFDSIAELEAADGTPRNPFVNAGAMLVTDRLVTLVGSSADNVVAFLRTESKAESSSEFDDNCFREDETVRRSEARNGHRNAALAHFLASYHLLENDVDAVLEEYYRQCSIAATCRQLARAASFLAADGLTTTGRRVLTPEATRTLNSILLTAGTYDGAADFTHRVGLPAKSGIGGGILAAMPGCGTVCVWSPGLDQHGTSAAGLACLEELCRLSGWSIFSPSRA